MTRDTNETPLERLRHHVTGAIERGEGEPVVEIPVDAERERLVEELHYAEEILGEIGAEFYGEVARYGDGWPGGRLRLWEIEDAVRLAREALRRHDATKGGAR